MKRNRTPGGGVDSDLRRMLWPKVLEAFLASNVDSNNTRQAYRRRIREAMTAMRTRSLCEITGMWLAGYRAVLMADGRGVATHAQALAALRSFLRWSGTLGAHGLRPDVIATALKLPRLSIQRPYETIGEREIPRLLRAAGSARNRAIIGILLGCGLRVAEVSALDVGDVRDEGRGRGLLYVRQGKGRRDRTVPIGRDVDRLIRAYLKETRRGRASNRPLFLAGDRGAGSRGGQRLSARSIGIMLAAVTRRAGLGEKRLTPHALRHSFAMRALRRTGNVVAVSKLMGHASIATTQRYVDHLEPEALMRTVGRFA